MSKDWYLSSRYKFDIWVFDTGGGLPKPRDYRDIPNTYAEGQFVMDIDRLQKRIKKSQLKLGLVEETIDDFIQSRPAPLAFFSIDLDFYPATMAALLHFRRPQMYYYQGSGAILMILWARQSPNLQESAWLYQILTPLMR